MVWEGAGFAPAVPGIVGFFKTSRGSRECWNRIEKKTHAQPMSDSEPGKKFRRNVCVVLTDESRGRVLVFSRVDRVLGPHRWQFPQGGLNPGEEPRQGALRELGEEIGTAEVLLLGQAERRVRYEYPPQVAAQLAGRDRTKAGFAGQEQDWFLGRLLHGTASINFRHQPAEFDGFRWATPAEAVELVVPFKKEAYREGLTLLRMLP